MKARIKSQNGGPVFISGDTDEIKKMKSILFFNLRRLDLPNSKAFYERIASLDKIEYQLTTCGRVPVGFMPNNNSKDNLRSQWHTFLNADLPMEFIFDVDLANKLAADKEKLSVNKAELKKDRCFTYDKYAYPIINSSNAAIIIAPLFTIKFILDGNHRFADTSEEMIQAVFLDYHEAASVISDPVRKEFYLLQSELINLSNDRHG